MFVFSAFLLMPHFRANPSLPDRSKPSRKSSYAGYFVDTHLARTDITRFQAKLEEKHGEKPQSK